MFPAARVAARMSDRPFTDRDWKSEADVWRARAEHLQRTVDRLRSLAVAGESAGFLAHELNNLYTPVVGYCHAAQAAGADEAIKQKAIAKSLAAAERVADLVGAILQLSGSAAAGSAVGGVCDVGECVDAGLLALGAEGWGREGVTVKVDVPRGTCVGAGAGVVQQVVMNLVLNARRAMVGRRGAIEVDAGEVGGMVRMEVRDRGVGMDRKLMQTVLGISGGDGFDRGDSGMNLRYEVDVQELARSGSINGQARWGVRVKAESEKRKAKIKAVERAVARLRGAKIDASASPIRVWDAEEVAAELRSRDVRHETRGASGGQEENDQRSTFNVQMENGGSVPSGGALKHGAHGVHGGRQSVESGEGVKTNRKSQMANGKSEKGTGRFGDLGCETRDVSRRGTGLGLALCLELVGRVGGRMWAESVVGEGTVVFVDWPRAEGAGVRRAA